MSDDEKQIEVKKIVEIITKEYKNKYGIICPAKAIRVATEILEHYQPKISEDAVVISQEEYDALKQIESYHIKSCGKGSVVLTREEYDALIKSKQELGCYIADQGILLQEVESIRNELKQARKETAKEFYDRLLWFGVKRIGQTTADSYIQISLERLQELAKQYGVEVED